MKKLWIPAFCLLHMVAIFWWTLPFSFGGMVATNTDQNSSEARLFKWLSLNAYPMASAGLTGYINLTGSQQYWDFFAPQSPKSHQYLSVCDSVLTDSQQGKISCQTQALFSNLTTDFAKFKRFGSDRSRLYRLTENLINLNDPQLLETFANYFRIHQQRKTALLILHQFELHPELNDLPKAGYRMDSILWSAP
jgi:hypothetical protein